MIGIEGAWVEVVVAIVSILVAICIVLSILWIPALRWGEAFFTRRIEARPIGLNSCACGKSWAHEEGLTCEECDTPIETRQ